MSEDFSVLMSVYAGDNPHCLVKAVESVIKQTMAPKEVIMVIDGPIGDELKNVIIKIKGQNSSVKVVYLPKNKGLGPALQEGLKECTTDLIARMDSDDISVPDRFEKQLKIFQKEENVDILGGLIAEFIGSCDNVVGIRSVPETNEEIYHYMKNRCPLNHVTVMFRSPRSASPAVPGHGSCGKPYRPAPL